LFSCRKDGGNRHDQKVLLGYSRHSRDGQQLFVHDIAAQAALSVTILQNKQMGFCAAKKAHSYRRSFKNYDRPIQPLNWQAGLDLLEHGASTTKDNYAVQEEKLHGQMWGFTTAFTLENLLLDSCLSAAYCNSSSMLQIIYASMYSIFLPY